MSIKARNEAINFTLKLVNETLDGKGALKGKSAYEIAVLNGFVGTEVEWMASLKGKPLDIKGQYNTYELLKGDNPNHSYMYAVGLNEPYDVYFWNEAKKDWGNLGKLNGVNEIQVGEKSYFPKDYKVSLPEYATAEQGEKADNALPKTGTAANSFKLNGKYDTEYATAAQGWKADNALLTTGGRVTGAVDFDETPVFQSGIVVNNNALVQWTPGYHIQGDSVSGYMYLRSFNGTRIINNDVGGLAPIYASNISGTSSKRYKHNIKSITDGKAKELLSMRPVSFEYNDDMQDSGNKYGLIAEELEKIDPTCCYYNGEQVEGINYTMLVPQLIKLCQTQQKEIDEIKSKLEEK